MGEEKQNWMFYEDAMHATEERQPANRKVRQQPEQHDDLSYEGYKENYEKYKAWVENEAHRAVPVTPKTAEEKMVYTCPGWRVYSPRWDEEEVLRNKKVKQWDAIVIFSKPQSEAWVSDHFPRCRVSPLRVSDRRQAESRLIGYRKRTKGMRRKDSYIPTDGDLGSMGEDDVL